jgi:hypothetical protein
MTTGILITTRGLVEQRDFSGLEDYQAAVGGYIESIFSLVDDRIQGFANEDGIFTGLETNVIASIVFGRYLVGDIVVIGPADEEGRTTDVSDAARSMISSVASSQLMHSQASVSR